MLALLGLLTQSWSVSGSVRYRGQELLGQSEQVLQKVRGREIGIVFQDPLASLNPVRTIGSQMTEILRLHLGLSKADARTRALELLQLVEMTAPDRRIDQYPHELSGGMRQRVLIAMAVACHPSILIADEPTTALDVTIQAQIIELVRKLQAELEMAVIWITHDLGVVAQVAQRVVVLYAGHVLERAPTRQLFDRALHPYTRGLLECIPTLDARDLHHELRAIPGQPPHPAELPAGCTFYPRCAYRHDARCATERPVPRTVQPGREVACLYELSSTPVAG
jgi:oligopeptide/dipeptide ABC transporter ATP-binding protein